MRAASRGGRNDPFGRDFGWLGPAAGVDAQPLHPWCHFGLGAPHLTKCSHFVVRADKAQYKTCR